MAKIRPNIVAHRGLHRDHPENSVEAMAAAFRAGIDTVELDVRLTADRVAVLMHDDSLDRTTTASGHLAAARWDDLREVRLKHNGRVTGCHVRQLHEAYRPIDNPQAEQLDPTRWVFVVEIKEYHPVLIRAVLDSRKLAPGRVIIQSFIPRIIEEVLQADQGCEIAVLCGDDEQLQAAVDARWRAVNMHHKLATEPLINQLHANGVATGVWTVNEEADIRRAINLSVGTIITDQPLMTRKLVEETARS